MDRKDGSKERTEVFSELPNAADKLDKAVTTSDSSVSSATDNSVVSTGAGELGL